MSIERWENTWLASLKPGDIFIFYDEYSCRNFRIFIHKGYDCVDNWRRFDCSHLNRNGYVRGYYRRLEQVKRLIM